MFGYTFKARRDDPLQTFVLQMLKEKQKELEQKAELLNKLTGDQHDLKDTTEDMNASKSLFTTDLLPLHRKQSVAKSKKQAVVMPLQGKTYTQHINLFFLPIDQFDCKYLCTPLVCRL